MNNYSKISLSENGRTELHDALSLTGAEISVNSLPAGASVPFVHVHRQNEEIYAVLEGKGKAEIDGESIEIKAGDWVRIAPKAKRRFFAADDEGIKYICIRYFRNYLYLHTGKRKFPRRLFYGGRGNCAITYIRFSNAKKTEFSPSFLRFMP